MSSLVIDLILCGLAYVILIFVMASMTRKSIRRDEDSGQDGDGGVEAHIPPKIDLPPGVIWPADSPKSPKIPEPADY